MPPRSDLKTQVAARLRELQPAYEEYLTLLEVQDTLKGLKPGASADGRATRRGPGRPRASGRPVGRPAGRRTKQTGQRAAARASTRGRAASTNGRRRRRRRTGATRADQALQLIKANPGITVPQIAERMGIRQNYLYRVTAGLQKQGTVKRSGGGFASAKR
jgi:hypothetical protein